MSRDGEWVAWDGYQAGYDNSPGECWVAKVDGTDVKKLAVGATPRWSPDGKQLLFMRDIVNDPTREPGIFVINRDGTEERRLAEGRWPDWAPDGCQIVYSVGGRRGTWGGSRIGAKVYIANLDGSNRKEIASGDCPSWSPDGKKIACCEQDPQKPAPIIRIVDLETNEQVVVGFGWFRANWSADSKSIVANGIVSQGKAGMVNLAADAERTPEQLFPQFRKAVSPCYSADGTKLVFIAERTSSEKK
jgi:Tol biopolymer transport system component